MRILLVDDEPAILEMLTAACTSDSHDVVSCTSSLEALDYLQTHKVDLLITDIAMPPPDGLQLVREAKSASPNLLAIVITGYSSRYALPDVLACGASDLMFKPFRIPELKARVALADERRRAFETLHERRRQLQTASAEMIQGLEEELVEVRRAGTEPGRLRQKAS
jgi:DNA-binding response OmpR family regulator